MIKKKLSILLSLSLVALFTSLLGTTSYAKILTQEEIENFCINALIFYNQENPSEETIEKIHDADFSLWIDASRTYEGRWYIALSGNYITFGYYTGTSSNLQTYGPYIYNNAIYVNTSYLTGKYSRISRSSFASTSSFSNGQTSINSVDDRFFYTDCNLYSTSAIANATVLYAAGYSTIDNIFSNGESDYFTFLLSPSIPTLTINGDSVPYFEFNSNTANDYYLGVLGKAEYYYDSELFEYRYYQGKWKLNKITKIQDIGEVEQNLISVTIKGRYLASNTLYSLQMNPDPDSDFAPYSQPFYMKDRNTVITNGELNTEDTFSGDYYNNYNNDTNTNDIINSITEGNPDSELAPIETMLSGDAQDVANNFGFWSAIGPNLFPSNIYNRIYDRMTMVTDVLYESGDVYFDFSMHGETPTRIHSSDIYLPNGALKTFISTFLIAGTCWLVWKQFYGYYELITTGNFILLFHDIDIDKTIFKM